MEIKKNFLFELWNDYAVYFADYNDITDNLVDNLLSSRFFIGQHFYYFVKPNTLQLYNVTESIKSQLNLSALPSTIHTMLDLHHPDDLEFLKYAEEWGFDQLVTLKQINQYKIGYIVRYKTIKNQYAYYYHQTYYTLNSRGKINACIHFNTNLAGVVNSMIYNIHLQDISTNEIVRQHLYIHSEDSILNHLTDREKDVIRQVLKGLNGKEIAEELSISIHTVRTHHGNINKKLNVKNRAELIKKCFELGFI